MDRPSDRSTRRWGRRRVAWLVRRRLERIDPRPGGREPLVGSLLELADRIDDALMGAVASVDSYRLPRRDGRLLARAQRILGEDAPDRPQVRLPALERAIVRRASAYAAELFEPLGSGAILAALDAIDRGLDELA